MWRRVRCSVRGADGDDEMRGSSGAADGDGNRDGDADGTDAMDDMDDTMDAQATDEGGGRGGGVDTPAATTQDGLASYMYMYATAAETAPGGEAPPKKPRKRARGCKTSNQRAAATRAAGDDV